MNRRSFTAALLLSGLAVLSVPGSVRADADFSEIIVFGDSISETGNLNLASGGVFAGPPYFGGRFSEAEPWYLESKAIRARLLGKDHPDYAKSLNNSQPLHPR